MRKALVMFAVLTTVGFLMAAVLGTGNPTDAQVIAIRLGEVGTAGSGIFDIPVPPSDTQFRPVQRVPRDKFGEVGPFPLQFSDLNALVYPDTTVPERQQMLEGMSLFTLAHTAAEGAGPMANQPFCLGCHQDGRNTSPYGIGVGERVWRCRVNLHFDRFSRGARHADQLQVHIARSGYRWGCGTWQQSSRAGWTSRSQC